MTFKIKGVNSGIEYGRAETSQDLELWFINHPTAIEVTRLDFANGDTVVCIERDEDFSAPLERAKPAEVEA